MKTAKRKQRSQEQVERYHRMLDEYKRLTTAVPTKTHKLVPVSSLGELWRWAQQDDRYDRLMMLTAQNLGWAVPTMDTGDLSQRAMRWLRINADETSEEGVVAEVNACRDLV